MNCEKRLPNRLSISEDSPAHRLYTSLAPDARVSLDAALDYIRDAPFEHGDLITARLLPPVVVYEYRDDEWRISYSLGISPSGATYEISVHAIARL